VEEEKQLITLTNPIMRMQTCAKEEKNFAKENYFEVNCLPARQRFSVPSSVFSAVSAAFTFLRRLSLAFIPLNRALTQAPLSCLSGCSCTARNAWPV